MKLTQERLKELLDYDPNTGIFTRKVYRSSNAKKDAIAGSLSKKGYWQIGIDSKDYKAHRLAFLYMEGYLPENNVDHIDRNRLNNRWDNLREVSQRCNVRNCSIRTDNKSGVTGICWCKKNNKWKVQINMSKNINLGYFDNVLDAAKARWEAEVKYNFPNCNTTSSAYMYLQKNKI